MNEKKTFELPYGAALELECNQEFYNKVRIHFGLAQDAIVSDETLKEFVLASFMTAYNQAEQQLGE